MKTTSQPIRNYALPHSETDLLRRQIQELRSIVWVMAGFWFLFLSAAVAAMLLTK